MKTINLDLIKFTEDECRSMIELLNLYKRKNCYISESDSKIINEIVIDISLDVLCGSLEYCRKILEEDYITKTIIFVWFIEIIKHNLKKRRVKELYFYYDPYTQNLRITLR